MDVHLAHSPPPHPGTCGAYLAYNLNPHHPSSASAAQPPPQPPSSDSLLLPSFFTTAHAASHGSAGATHQFPSQAMDTHTEHVTSAPSSATTTVIMPSSHAQQTVTTFPKSRKRKAESQENERLSKRLSLLNIGTSHLFAFSHVRSSDRIAYIGRSLTTHAPS